MSALTKFLQDVSDVMDRAKTQILAGGIEFANASSHESPAEKRGGTHSRKRKAQTGRQRSVRNQRGHCRKLAEYVS